MFFSEQLHLQAICFRRYYFLVEHDIHQLTQFLVSIGAYSLFQLNYINYLLGVELGRF